MFMNLMNLLNFMNNKYQLRVIVRPSGQSVPDGKYVKPLFERYISCPLDEVRFSAIIDVMQQFFNFPVQVEFIYESLNQN